jgi:hypothetical protein
MAFFKIKLAGGAETVVNRTGGPAGTKSHPRTNPNFSTCWAVSILSATIWRPLIRTNLHPTLCFLELTVSGFVFKNVAALGGEKPPFRPFIFNRLTALGGLFAERHNVALPLVQFVCWPRSIRINCSLTCRSCQENNEACRKAPSGPYLRTSGSGEKTGQKLGMKAKAGGPTVAPVL